jgi:hypothetical protein
MSDANRTSVRVVQEVTRGVTPASPAFQELRVTASGLTAQPNFVQSSELVSDRQVRDQILVGVEPGGNIPQEVSFGALDPVLPGVMFNPWAVKLQAEGGTEITAVSSTAYTTSTRPSAFALGMLIRASGFTNAANNGLKLLTGGSTTSATVSGGATETPGATARLKLVGFQCANGDCAANGAGKTLTISATSGTWTSLGLQPGEWVKVGGADTGTKFATAANNSWARIATVTATVLTFDIVPANWATDNGSGKTIRIWVGDYIRNGVTPISYTVEESFDDLSPVQYQYYRGMQPNQLQLQADAQAILTSSVDFIGRSIEGPVTTRFASATTIAPPEGEVLSASANVGRIAVDGGDSVTGPNFVLGSSITIQNQLRRKNAVGVLGTADVGAGRVMVSGELNTYYGDSTILAKVRANTAASWDARFIDPNGTRAIVIDVPRLKFGGGDPEVGGVDQDRTLNTPFMGLRHPVLGYTVQFQRFEEFEA